MYFAIVVLFLLICPAASVAIEALRTHQALTSLALIARWWTFWAIGVRLGMAGVRQVIQPRFTAAEIFRIHDPAAHPIVREIGFANLSLGTLGLLSLIRPDWVIPAALTGGLYYALAGLLHLAHKEKNAKEYTAMLSDFFAAAILGTCVVRTLF